MTATALTPDVRAAITEAVADAVENAILEHWGELAASVGPYLADLEAEAKRKPTGLSPDERAIVDTHAATVRALYAPIRPQLDRIEAEHRACAAALEALYAEPEPAA